MRFVAARPAIRNHYYNFNRHQLFDLNNFFKGVIRAETCFQTAGVAELVAGRFRQTCGGSVRMVSFEHFMTAIL